jgi:hypothetical protein
MNRVVTSRVSTLMTAAIVVIIAACSDADGSKTGLTGPNASTSTGGSAADSAKNTPGNPGGGHPDTSGTPTPAPKPVASFMLAVHVGSPRPGAKDTLTTDPIADATVSVYEQTITFIHHPGADTANINQTLVASGPSDATGSFSVPNLKGTGEYLIKVAPPAGSNFGPASVFINQAYLDVVNVLVTLHGK